MAKQITYGMVGGGPGSFIGKVHRMAANLDGKMKLVAGAFSSDYQKSRQMGKELNIPDKRVYESYQAIESGKNKKWVQMDYQPLG